MSLLCYRKATSLTEALRALRGSARAFREELGRLDAVWVFGPQRPAMPFAWFARRHGTPLIIGVRRDHPEYIRNRLSSRWWAVPIAAAMDLFLRLLARRAPTVALAEEIAARYRGGAPVVTTGFSLVPRSEVRALDVPEKNPLLPLDVIAALRECDPRWRLIIAGDGPLRPRMQERIVDLGLNGHVDVLGGVADGPDLWRLSRDSHLFLHGSLKARVPQVLLEAQAAGLPIVATAVGDVPEALGGGSTGLLVPPAVAQAAVDAVRSVARDAELRPRLVTAALAHAEHETLEAQLDRLPAFFRQATNGCRP